MEHTANETQVVHRFDTRATYKTPSEHKPKLVKVRPMTEIEFEDYMRWRNRRGRFR